MTFQKLVVLATLGALVVGVASVNWLHAQSGVVNNWGSICDTSGTCPVGLMQNGAATGCANWGYTCTGSCTSCAGAAGAAPFCKVGKSTDKCTVPFGNTATTPCGAASSAPCTGSWLSCVCGGPFVPTIPATLCTITSGCI